MNKLYGVKDFFKIKKNGIEPTLSNYIVEIEVESETRQTITLKFPGNEKGEKYKKRVAFSMYYRSYDEAVQKVKDTMLYLKCESEAMIEKRTKLIAIWETVLKEIEEVEK